MKEEYLVVSWWIDPAPRNVKVIPEIGEFNSKEEAIEEGRKKKKQLGSGNRVVISEVIEEL